MDSDDKRISQLTQVTSLNDSDLFVVSIDVGTAPKTRGIKKSDAIAGGGTWGSITGTLSDQTDLQTALDGWIAKTETWTARTQAYTNDPASGSNITLNIANTSGFHVDDRVTVSSSAGSETAIITTVVANTSITVKSLSLNHTTTSPLITHQHGFTLSGDQSSNKDYQPKLKVKYTNSTAKYGVIKSNEYASSVTYITLIRTSDYKTANASFSSTYISRITKPNGFPTTFNFDTEITYSGGTTDPTSNTVNSATWRMVENDIGICIQSTLVRGSGNRQFTRFSCPVAALLAAVAFNGIDNVTASGLIPGASYISSDGMIYYKQTMANDGVYYLNGIAQFA